MKYPTGMNPLRRRGRLTTALAAAALLSIPIAAEAVHWPMFGGDAGRSGNQPVQQATMPAQFKYTVTDTGTLKTSVITSGGAAADQVLSYGKYIVNANGGSNGVDDDVTAIHIRKLSDGSDKVPANQMDIDDFDDDLDSLGVSATGQPGGTSVSFADTSTGTGLGQVYVVHNDNDSDSAHTDDCPVNPFPTFSDNDLAIAQFDEATGEKKFDRAVGLELGTPGNGAQGCAENPQVSEGYTIESSPVITPPLDAGGRRILLFIARPDTVDADHPHPRLFAVTINNAGAANAQVLAATPTIRDVPNANTQASPSLVYFHDADRAAVVLYVMVPINASAGAAHVRSFQVDDIGDPNEDGPSTPTDVPASANFRTQTVSVPVTANGMLPGQQGSGAAKAPAIYVAMGDNKGTTNNTAAHHADDTTTVRKFVQQGDDTVLTQVAASATNLEGFPSPALAVSALASGSGETPGRVVLTTGENVIGLLSDNLSEASGGRLRDTPGEAVLTAGSTGFSRTSPLVSGDFIFVANDDGAQFVLNLGDAERVPSSDFQENTANNTSDFSIGQPSISRGFLQFLSDRGLFVYQTGVIIPPPPANAAPVASFTAAPNPAKPGETVTFDASGSSDSDGTITNYSWDLDGNGDFERDTGTTPTVTNAYANPGTYNVALRVTDDGGATSTVSKPLVVGQPAANRPPTASFTITPSPARTGQVVTFNGAASSDPDGPLARFEWDLDGNGSYETNTGTNPTATRTYAVGGIFNIRLRVTDAGGLSTETIRQLVVTGPGGSCAQTRCRAGITARVTPSRDRTLPYRFTASGRITRPSGLSASDGCRGRVSVQYKRGRRTVSSRRTSVRSNCTYRLRTSFRDRKRLGTARSLRVTVRFQGNSFLLPRSARTRTVRIG